MLFMFVCTNLLSLCDYTGDHILIDDPNRDGDCHCDAEPFNFPRCSGKKDTTPPQTPPVSAPNTMNEPQQAQRAPQPAAPSATETTNNTNTATNTTAAPRPVQPITDLGNIPVIDINQMNIDRTTFDKSLPDILTMISRAEERIRNTSDNRPQSTDTPTPAPKTNPQQTEQPTTDTTTNPQSPASRRIATTTNQQSPVSPITATLTNPQSTASGTTATMSNAPQNATQTNETVAGSVPFKPPTVISDPTAPSDPLTADIDDAQDDGKDDDGNDSGITVFHNMCGQL